jgi:uncharacterized protein (DUF169 family)
MANYHAIEEKLRTALHLDRRPIAISFRETPPSGISKFSEVAPSGCSFWPLAAEGRTFYTVSSDHYNCPVGAYTHNIPLPAERAQELNDTLGLMARSNYIRMEEVPRIPQLSRTPEVVVYAPLADTPVDPDVVLFWGAPGRLMLLEEAAIRAQVSSHLNTLARPTCMALPAALSMGVVASTGCVGNRVYAGVDDKELFIAVPWRDLLRIADEVETISAANAELLAYHQTRRDQMTNLATGSAQ